MILYCARYVLLDIALAPLRRLTGAELERLFAGFTIAESIFAQFGEEFWKGCYFGPCAPGCRMIRGAGGVILT